MKDVARLFPPPLKSYGGPAIALATAGRAARRAQKARPTPTNHFEISSRVLFTSVKSDASAFAAPGSPGRDA